MTTILICDRLLGQSGRVGHVVKSVRAAMTREFHEFVHNPGYPEF
jgi:hypothetical protein